MDRRRKSDLKTLYLSQQEALRSSRFLDQRQVYFYELSS